MLAYVFWHWPNTGVDKTTYQQNLIHFHKTLSENPPPGFARSVVFSIDEAPWLDTDGEAFEEWYLLQDSAALDQLNHAAVSGVCEEPHNCVARDAAGGTAGLYRLRTGQGKLSDSLFAQWFAKPRGVSYADFYSTLGALSSQDGAALWSRQMTLGPTPEFCLLSANPVKLPPGFDGSMVHLEAIWSGAREF